jgi:hypothetical protein
MLDSNTKEEDNHIIKREVSKIPHVGSSIIKGTNKKKDLVLV